MDEVFRFLFLRPPAPGAPVTVQPSADFARELAAADSAANCKEAQKAAAAKLIASPRNIGALSDLGIGSQLIAFEAALAGLLDPTPAQVTKAVKDIFGKTSAQVVKLPAFAQDRDRLSDNLIAAKLLSRDGTVEAKRLEAALRLMALIERVAADEATLKASRRGAGRPAKTNPARHARRRPQQERRQGQPAIRAARQRPGSAKAA